MVQLCRLLGQCANEFPDFGGNNWLIPDVSLLEKLAALQLTFSQMGSLARESKDFHYNILLPFLIENANLAQIAATIEHEPGRPENEYDFPEITVSDSQNHAELLSRADFQGLLYAKIDLYGDLFRPGYLKLEEQLDEAITLLEEELAK